MSTYVRMGRGGAGNHIPNEELQKRAEDLEAQLKASTANQLAQEEVMSPPPGEYKHMGRGGAGNWFTPSELTQTGTTATPTEDDDTTEVPVTQTSSTRQWAGRGGAGNFAGAQDALPKQTEEIELQERERLQKEVRMSVDQELAKPQGVHLGP